MDRNDQCKSLDVLRNAIQPSLEPENDTIIDRQLDAVPVKEVELQYTETSGTRIEPEVPIGHRLQADGFTAEPDHTELSEPEYVHVPEPHYEVDEITANMAPTSGSPHGGPVSEMIPLNRIRHPSHSTCTLHLKTLHASQSV